MDRWKVTGLALAISVGATAVSAGPDYRALVHQGVRTLQAAQTCTAEFSWAVYPGVSEIHGKLYLKRPHFIHGEYTWEEDGHPITEIQHDDGVRGIQITISQVTADLNSTSRERVDGIIRPLGETRVGDSVCQTLKISDPDRDLHLILAAPDGTVRGYTFVWRQNTEASMVTGRLTSLVLNQPLPESVLNWKPPAGRADGN